MPAHAVAQPGGLAAGDPGDPLDEGGRVVGPQVVDGVAPPPAVRDRPAPPVAAEVGYPDVVAGPRQADRQVAAGAGQVELVAVAPEAVGQDDRLGSRDGVTRAPQGDAVGGGEAPLLPGQPLGQARVLGRGGGCAPACTPARPRARPAAPPAAGASSLSSAPRSFSVHRHRLSRSCPKKRAPLLAEPLVSSLPPADHCYFFFFRFLLDVDGDGDGLVRPGSWAPRSGRT